LSKVHKKTTTEKVIPVAEKETASTESKIPEPAFKFKIITSSLESLEPSGVTIIAKQGLMEFAFEPSNSTAKINLTLYTNNKPNQKLSVTFSQLVKLLTK